MNEQQRITAGEGFAIWLANNHPALFEALATRALQKAGFAGWSDIIKSIGSGLSTAVKSVGTYLASAEGVKTLSALTSTYLVAKAQQNLVNVQARRAEQGMEPAPVTYVTDPSGVMTPVYSANGITAQLTYPVLQQFDPGPSYQQYLKPLAIAAGIGLVAVLIIRR